MFLYSQTLFGKLNGIHNNSDLSPLKLLQNKGLAKTSPGHPLKD